MKKLSKLSTDIGDIFVSSDMEKSAELGSNPGLSMQLIRATLREDYPMLLGKELATLHAHGWQNNRGIWVHGDGLMTRPVKEWVTEPVKDWVAEQDGKYKFLFLFSCESMIFQAEKSYLLIPGYIEFTSDDPNDPYRGGHRPTMTLVPPRAGGGA